MKKIVIICIITSIAFVANAQQFNWGVKAGLNVSSLTGVDGSNYKPGFHAGLTGQYMFNENMGLQADLLYSMLGYKAEYTDYAFKDFGDTGDPENWIVTNYKETVTATSYYLQLPVSFVYKFKVGNQLFLNPSAGLYFGYGVGGDYTSKWIETEDESQKVIASGEKKYDYFDKEINNKLDFGLDFGLDLQYQKFIVGLGYNFSFTNVNKDTRFAWKDQKNVNIKLSVGYFF